MLPTKNLTLTLLPASPRPIFRLFVQTPLASYGAIGQKKRRTPLASYRAEWVKVLSCTPTYLNPPISQFLHKNSMKFDVVRLKFVNYLW